MNKPDMVSVLNHVRTGLMRLCDEEDGLECFSCPFLHECGSAEGGGGGDKVTLERIGWGYLPALYECSRCGLVVCPLTSSDEDVKAGTCPECGGLVGSIPTHQILIGEAEEE